MCSPLHFGADTYAYRHTCRQTDMYALKCQSKGHSKCKITKKNPKFQAHTHTHTRTRTRTNAHTQRHMHEPPDNEKKKTRTKTGEELEHMSSQSIVRGHTLWQEDTF